VDGSEIAGKCGENVAFVDYRSKSLGLVTALLMVLGLAVGQAPAFADDPSASSPVYQISTTQITGTPAWDADDLPGHDSGPNNLVVRTNDNITYNVEVRYENGDGATVSNDTTITIALPQGVASKQLPPFCDASGSSLTPATLPAPTVPLTSDSWEALPAQTLVCNVGARIPGSTFSYPFVVQVRSEVPNGTVLDDVEPLVTSDLTTDPVPSANKVSAVVSAAASWDLSKNNINLAENSGDVLTGDWDPCSWDATKACFRVTYPILIGSSNFGKGSTPALSPITFTDQLTPRKLFGEVSSPLVTEAQLAAMESDPQKYAVRLGTCAVGRINSSTPGFKVDGDITTENGVRDSGSISCTQPGGLGTPVQVRITNTDTSLITHPTRNRAGTALPGNLGYVFSGAISVYIPMDTVVDFGEPIEGGFRIKMRNTFTDLNIRGLDGTPQADGVDAAWNNYRQFNITRTFGAGIFNKSFSGVSGDPGNSSAEGLPGYNEPSSGEGRVLPEQEVLSRVSLAGASSFGDPNAAAIGCDTWDTSKLQMIGGNVPGSTIVSTMSRPSNGAPAWIGGVGWTRSTSSAPKLTVASLNAVIQYSNGGGSAATAECSSGSWYDDPADVPGNDPAELANGVYTGVSRVRVYVELPAPAAGRPSAMLLIHQRVKDDLADQTIVPNWANAKFAYGTTPGMTALAADASRPWPRNNYNPTTNTGVRGDRVIVSRAQSRIQKYLRVPGETGYSLGASGVKQVTGGQVVDYRLNPTLTSRIVGSPVQMPVVVEDCLPAGQSLVESTPVPDEILSASPSGAGLTCPAGATYLRWDLGMWRANVDIPPIHYKARIAIVAPPGTYTNTALVTTINENNQNVLDRNRRTTKAQVQVVQPAGVQVDKRAGVPYVEVNRAGETHASELSWDIDLVNINTPDLLSDPDVIDRLPAQGVHDTDFHGSLELVSASTADSRLEIWFTKDAGLEEAPDDARNLEGGATVWCDAGSGGTPVHRGTGDTATAADCPADLGEVTGLRIRFKPVAGMSSIPFASGDILSAHVVMRPMGNRGGDVYDNCVTGRVVGLGFNVGPRCEPITVVASSIGDRVWNDINKNGIQDPGETGVGGFAVSLSGVDRDGNTVTETTTTAGDGTYSFTDLPSGDYEVTFDPASLGGDNSYFTTTGVGADPAMDSDADQVTGKTTMSLGVDEKDVTIDTGVAQDHPQILITKYINDDDANVAPGVMVDAGTELAITMKVKNTGDVALSDVRVNDDVIDSDDITCPKTALEPGEEMVCTATHPAPAAGKLHTNTATTAGTGPANPTTKKSATVTDQDQANATSRITVVDPPQVQPPVAPPVRQPKSLPNTGGPNEMLLFLGATLLGLGVVTIRRKRRN
jgi:LPXTG-motif cell wall-anchored protein